MPFELLPEEVSPESSESFGSQALRGSARTASRIGEQIAGAPGDIFSLINDFIAKPAVESITGKPGVSYEETLLGKILPTTFEHRKRTTQTIGKTIEPQNKLEKFFDDLVTDATSVFLPGKKTGIAKSIGSSLFKSFGANVSKEAVQDLTSDEKKGALAHMGALGLLSIIDKKSAAQAISEGYKPLEAKVSKLLPVSANKLETNLNNLKSKMQKGTQAPSEQFIIDEVDKVLGKVKDGKITPEEAWASKRSLNEKITDVLYNIKKKDHQKRARKLASVISHELDDTLALTQKQDPKFYKDLKSWNTAFKTVADSNLISRWIENNMKYSPLSIGLLHVIGSPVFTKGTAGLLLPYEASKVLYRISKSRKLAKHYSKVISLAAAENAPAFNHQLKILDKELQKEEKKDRFELLPD